MQDGMTTLDGAAPRIDAKVLRHMMMETIDLLDLSSDHADEACQSTDAAMALTRIDWMLMAVFNWLTRQLRTDSDTPEQDAESLGKPVSIIGIDQDALSDALREYGQTVDRLHARVRQLESLVKATEQTVVQPLVTVEPRQPSGMVLNIFGDPSPHAPVANPVLESQLRLKSAFGGF